MEILEIIFPIAWFVLSFGLAFLIYKRIIFFRKVLGTVVIFLIFIFFSVLHNIVSKIMGFEEAALFFASIFSFGVMVSLLILQLFSKAVKIK